MKYLAIRPGDAKLVLDRLRDDEDVDLDNYVRMKGEGELVSDGMLDDAATALDEIRAKYPKSLKPKDPAGGKFEAEAAPIFYELMKVPPEMAADKEFWAWLAMSKFRELIEWRHGLPDKPASPANFGAGTQWENLLPRLWFRVELSLQEDAKDPYSLSRRGDQDFWRSHIFRQRYSSCRTLTRELIRFQYPDRSPKKAKLHPSSPNGVRELAKRIRRIHTSLALEILDDETSAGLIGELSANLQKRKRLSLDR